MAPSWNRYLLIGLSLALIGAFIYFFGYILAYVLSAWVLSLIGQPLMTIFRRIKIGKWRLGPGLCAALTLLSFFVVAIVLFLIFVPTILQQAANLAQVDYPAIAKALEEPYSHGIQWIEQHGILMPEATLEALIKNALKGWFEPQKLGEFVAAAIGTLGSIVVNVVSVLFITFFFLQERRLFINFILALVPKEHEDATLETIRQSIALLSRYFAGILIQMAIITVFITVVLTFLGIKNALLIGLFGALMNVIPYLGPILGAGFALFITISSNLDLDFYTQLGPMLIKVFVVFSIMQQLDNYFLQPYIFSTSVKAHPLEIFLVILMGATVSGVAGMILAIPVYTVLRVMAKEFLSHFKIVRKIARNLDEAS